MKKILALALAAMMVLSLAACGNTNDNTNTTAGTTAGTTEATTEVTTEATVEDTTGAAVVTNPSVEIMLNIWNKYTNPDETPFIMGGSDFQSVPGNYDLTDAEIAAGLSGILYVPAEELANIDEAATAMHAMMANNFTAGVVHVTSDVTAFADTMTETLKNNQWICGQPETLVVAVIDAEYVLVGFGAGDIMTGFIANVTAAYPEANVVYNGAIA